MPASASSARLRLCLAGGGTGGHVVPGLHLLAALAERGELADVLWLGSGRRAEERALATADPALGLERVGLSLEPRGGGAPSTWGLLRRTAPAVLRARRALRERETEVLLGLGGFVTLPAVLAARSLGLPVLLFEINAVAGRATRTLGPLAHRVAYAFEGTGTGGRALWTGAPLAPGFPVGRGTAGERGEARRSLGFEPGRPLVLVLGGSQGAGALNAFVRSAAPTWTAAGLQLLHQAGPGRRDEGPQESPGVRVVEYLDDVGTAMRAAELALCRGGAATLVEVAGAELPALVVPYPHHRDRQQERNARALEPGVQIVSEGELNAACIERVLALAQPAAEGERAAMSGALRERAPAGGAERLAAALLRLARG